MLLLCTKCDRHVRDADGACPFCGALEQKKIIARAPRMSRAARIVSVAAIGVACGGTSNPSDGGGGDAMEEFSAEPSYGAVPIDAGIIVDASKDASDAGTETDAKNDVGSGALYGAPPPPNGG